MDFRSVFWRIIIICVYIITNFTCTTSKRNTKPNIVFILTDDQDVRLGGMVNHIIYGVYGITRNVYAPELSDNRSSLLT